MPWHVVGPVVSGAVVLVSIVVVIMMSAGPNPPPPPISTTTAHPSTVVSTGPSTTRPGTTTSSTSPVTLADLLQEDAATVSDLAGSWVPQVSSKAVGTVADGTVYDVSDILADHLRLRARYPEAVILRSSRFPTFSGPGYYVTVIDRPYSSAAEANAWCDAAGLPVDGCFAKLLATTPTTPSTVHR